LKSLLFLQHIAAGNPQWCDVLLKNAGDPASRENSSDTKGKGIEPDCPGPALASAVAAQRGPVSGECGSAC